MTEKSEKKSMFEKPFFSTRVKSANVKLKEMLFGYFLGPFFALLASGIFTTYLNVYWKTVLFADYVDASGNLPASIDTFMSLLPLLSAILIVAGNLVVGQLIERTRTKAGKARPWMLLSSVILAVSCILLFVIPTGNGVSTPVLTMVFTAIAYNLYYAIAYPMYNTATSTLVPLSTRNSKQRGLLASFTNFAALGLQGVGGMIFPFIVSFFLGTNQGAWMIAFVAIGVLSFLFTVVQYYYTRERVTEESLKSGVEQKEKISIKKQLKAVASDKFWWFVIIFYLVFQFGGMMKNLAMPFFCRDQFSSVAIGSVTIDGDMALSVINIVAAVPMAIAMLFIFPASSKFGKRVVVLIGCILSVAGGVLAGCFYSNFYVVVVGVALKSFGSSPACYLILAMISDVLDHIEAKRGIRCDGLTMSIYSSIMAASTPIMTGIFNAVTHSGANATGNIICYIWVETAAYAIGIVLMIFFFVEKFLKGDRVQILERQKAEALAAGVEWIEPEERLRREQEQAELEADLARQEELKAYCAKKGLEFEAEEAKYQQKQAEKRRVAEAKKAAKEAKKAAKKGVAESTEQSAPEETAAKETEVTKDTEQDPENK